MSTDDIQLEDENLEKIAEALLTPEERLVKQFNAAALELKEARRILVEARRKATDAETRTIDAKITCERLIEQLRRIKSAKVIDGESYASYDEDDGNG